MISHYENCGVCHGVWCGDCSRSDCPHAGEPPTFASLLTPVEEENKKLKARVAELEAKGVQHAEEIDEWKEASGIVTGSGDPADVTPRMASSYWNDIDRDLTKSQIKVEDLETELRMAKIGDEVGHKLLDIAIDDGAEKVAELISLRARVAELEYLGKSDAVTLAEVREWMGVEVGKPVLTEVIAASRDKARVAELEEPQVGIVRCPHCEEEHDVQLSRGRTNDPNTPDKSVEGGS